MSLLNVNLDHMAMRGKSYQDPDDIQEWYKAETCPRCDYFEFSR